MKMYKKAKGSYSNTMVARMAGGMAKKSMKKFPTYKKLF